MLHSELKTPNLSKPHGPNLRETPVQPTLNIDNEGRA